MHNVRVLCIFFMYMQLCIRNFFNIFAYFFNFAIDKWILSVIMGSNQNKNTYFRRDQL